MRLSENSPDARLDDAAAVNDRRYAMLRAENGWGYHALPSVSDGALHAYSRRLVGRLILRANVANRCQDSACGPRQWTLRRFTSTQ